MHGVKETTEEINYGYENDNEIEKRQRETITERSLNNRNKIYNSWKKTTNGITILTDRNDWNIKTTTKEAIKRKREHKRTKKIVKR